VEQAGLEAEAQAYEKSTSSLKQQYNIIGVAAEVSGWGLEPQQQPQQQGQAQEKVQEKVPSSEVNANANANAVTGARDGGGKGQAEPLPGTDLRYMQLDEVLELTVLNEEIRACLPSLESHALQLESQIFAIDKATAMALAAQKELPPLLNKTAEELEVEMGVTIEKKILIKTQMASQVNSLRKEKAALVSRISSLREQLALAADERDVLNNTTAELRMGISQEFSKINVLTKAVEDTRLAFDQHHGPIGWAKEAWLAEQERRGGSSSSFDEDMRLTEDQIVDVLAAWASSKQSHMCNVKHVKECLVDLGGTCCCILAFF